jgi:TonB family protein
MRNECGRAPQQNRRTRIRHCRTKVELYFAAMAWSHALKDSGISAQSCCGLVLLGFSAFAFAQSSPAASAAPTVAPSPVHRLKISETASSQLLVQKVPPRYPEESLRAGIAGVVVLEAGIDALGAVQDVTVVSGDPTLAQAAAAAVRQWKYKPYRLVRITRRDRDRSHAQLPYRQSAADRFPSARHLSRRQLLQRIFQSFLSPPSRLGARDRARA